MQITVVALALFEKQIDAGLTNSFPKRLQVDWQESVFERILFLIILYTKKTAVTRRFVI
jgi:hypothetical protein